MFLRTRSLQLLTLVLGWAFCGVVLPFSGHAQRDAPVVDKMEPPHWWNSGSEREFVLVLNGTGLADCTVSAEEPGLTVLANERRAHPDYLFVRLRIETGCDAGAKALDLTMDASGHGLGLRSQRYAMIVEDGVAKAINVEQPGAFEVSSADAVMRAL